MEFRILGPPEVVSDGQALELGGAWRPQGAAQALPRAVALYEARGNVLAAATARQRVRELGGRG
jgi:hypothetical protein